MRTTLLTMINLKKHITINVTKDGNNLKAEVVYQDGKTFNNTFTPNATNASIELDKNLMVVI